MDIISVRTIYRFFDSEMEKLHLFNYQVVMLSNSILMNQEFGLLIETPLPQKSDLTSIEFLILRANIELKSK